MKQELKEDKDEQNEALKNLIGSQETMRTLLENNDNKAVLDEMKEEIQRNAAEAPRKEGMKYI